MRHFSFRPSLTMKGRENRGLRGLAGKPFHPPLTDIPVAAYLFAAVFDIVSVAIGSGGGDGVARQLFLAGSWTVLGGVAVSLLAALTGWADWHRSSEPGNQARRTINAHAVIMLTVTAVALVDLLVRFIGYPDAGATPVGLMILSIIAAALVAVGATYGGGLVFDYGFNVETAGDSPVWHESETDVLPGSHPA
ncbi:MAG: DUF2231 domain-containing protein [Jatrophihabitans sp.]|nr:MAG: DUF2231 domain-containing protein [Jatrophihabitans sp.]